jgi:hypothetical protein
MRMTKLVGCMLAVPRAVDATETYAATYAAATAHPVAVEHRRTRVRALQGVGRAVAGAVMGAVQ